MSSIAVNSSDTVLSKTFTLLGLSMIPTALGSFVASTLSLPVGVPQIIFIIVMFLLSLGVMYATFRYSSEKLFLLFSFIIGAMIGPFINAVLERADGESIIFTAALITAAALFGITGYVKKTKKDFSYLGGFLFGALIALIVGGVLQIFIQSSVMEILLSVAGVIIFLAYILYDVSEVVTGKQTNHVHAAVSIYLDVVNLFIDLIRLLLAFSGSDD